MCLDTMYSQDKLEKEIKTATIGGEYIRLYKAVRTRGRKFANVCFNIPTHIFTNSINIARQKKIVGGSCGYISGFHCCNEIADALNWGHKQDVIEILVKPSWVTTVGFQFYEKTFVCSKMVDPKYPAKKVTIREFRRICKEHGNDNQKTKS